MNGEVARTIEDIARTANAGLAAQQKLRAKMAEVAAEATRQPPDQTGPPA